MGRPRAAEGVTVLLADDHPAFDRSLAGELEASDRVELVGHVHGGAEAVELVGSLRPRVVLMDVTEAGAGGVDATRRILETWPATTVLVLADSCSGRAVRDATEAGAAGYFCLEETPAKLVRLVIELVAGAPDTAGEDRGA